MRQLIAARYFFQGSIANAYSALKSPELDLWLNPAPPNYLPLFMERLYKRGDRVGTTILALKNTILLEPDPDPLWLESELNELLAKVYHPTLTCLTNVR